MAILQAKKINYSENNLSNILKEVRGLIADKKTELLNSVPGSMGVSLRVFFGGKNGINHKMYTYNESTFMGLDNYSRMFRVLMAVYDQDNAIIGIFPCVEFVEE